MLTTYNEFKWKWEIDPEKELKHGDYFITCMHDGSPTPQKVKGYLVNEGGRKFVLHRVPNRNMWGVSDYETGLQIVSNVTREKAAREFDFKNRDNELIAGITTQAKNPAIRYGELSAVDLAEMISAAYSEMETDE